MVLLVLAAGTLLFLQLEQYRFGDSYRVSAKAIIRDHEFSVAQWEVGALGSELSERLGIYPYGPTDSRAQQEVRDYLDVARRIGSLEDQLERDAAAGTEDGSRSNEARSLQKEINDLRARQEARRPAVERTLERQISSVIGGENLGWWGGALPPVAFQFTEPPYYLVLSPRDEIKLRLGLLLVPSASLETRETVELAVEEELPNTSALVDGIGGFSTWPTMIIDRANLEWVLSTIAHEWVHTYLIGFPLGWEYFGDNDAAAINETVADIVGNEVGGKALRRYYPDLAPPPVPDERSLMRVHRVPAFEPPPFSFNEEMRITRERVDALLAEGRVAEAEEYMEERRLFLLENGYYIRRLNQAYFAYHGAYRTGAAAPSEDPIGPRLRRLREESADLASFLQAVRGMTGLDDLIARVPEP